MNKYKTLSTPPSTCSEKIGNGGRVQTTPDHDSVENISISGQNLVQGPVE